MQWILLLKPSVKASKFHLTCKAKEVLYGSKSEAIESSTVSTTKQLRRHPHCARQQQHWEDGVR
eukprot:1146684-Pelagomonas_calceolata.AAC.5